MAGVQYLSGLDQQFRGVPDSGAEVANKRCSWGASVLAVCHTLALRCNPTNPLTIRLTTSSSHLNHHNHKTRCTSSVTMQRFVLDREMICCLLRSVLQTRNISKHCTNVPSRRVALECAAWVARNGFGWHLWINQLCSK